MSIQISNIKCLPLWNELLLDQGYLNTQVCIDLTQIWLPLPCFIRVIECLKQANF